MEKFYYAILNNDNICTGISELVGEVIQANMIRIETYDMVLLNKKYIQGTQVFEEVPKTTEQLLAELKNQYLSLIKEADLLGDNTEKTKLQEEYVTKKVTLEIYTKSKSSDATVEATANKSVKRDGWKR